MINPLIPTCGYIVPDSNTLYPEINPDYDNTQPRYVTMSSMPSDVITQVLSESSQRTETNSFFLSKWSEYNKSDANGLVISQEELANQKRYKKLYKSFMTHKGEKVSNMQKKAFEMLASALSVFDFSDSFVEYSEISNLIDFSLLFDNGLELTVGKYFDVDEKDVVAYSISYNDELVISNMIRLPRLKTKFNEVLAEIA